MWDRPIAVWCGCIFALISFQRTDDFCNCTDYETWLDRIQNPNPESDACHFPQVRVRWVWPGSRANTVSVPHSLGTVIGNYLSMSWAWPRSHASAVRVSVSFLSPLMGWRFVWSSLAIVIHVHVYCTCTSTCRLYYMYKSSVMFACLLVHETMGYPDRVLVVMGYPDRVLNCSYGIS